ncbi:immunoglobulin I-set domain-containing protein [Colletotrichum camelliae]|nr:immunoglobulin I-set domain-containing protein [Colletotrichum camelliae]
MNDVSSINQQICERCLRIDFGNAFQALEGGRMDSHGIILDDDARRLASGDETTCSLCNILSNATLSSPVSDSKVQKFELRAFSYLQNSIGVRHATPGAQDSLMFLVTLKNQVIFDEPLFADYGYDGNSYVVCTDGQPGLLKPQEIPELFDHGRARLWMDNCKEDHGPPCTKPISSAVIPGMRLINCNTLQIEPAHHGMKWITLSYVWSPHFASSSAQVDHRLPSELSASVEDAITLTKLLGYQYLWVDKYCIDQSNVSELSDQISKMDLIYNNAEATIVAAAGPDETYGLPGVNTTTRSKQDVVHVDGTAIFNMGPHPAVYVERESRWWKRGWTFQEGLLSRRRIIFTETQAFFECNTASWTEILGGIDHYMGQPETHAATEAAGGGVNELAETPAVDSSIARGLFDFFRLIQQYTTRSLTYDSDSLNAAAATTLQPPVILLSSNETAAVKRAATSLSNDFGRVLGKNSTVVYDTLNTSTTFPILVIGTLGYSPLLSGLKLQNSSIQGKWESYTHEVIKDPFPGIPSALSVVGSDKRGTVYGIYALSEQIGVSPWYFWADVPVTPLPSLHLSPAGKTYTHGPPSVKYRGIFINDEETCLTSWARSRFPLASSDRNRPFTSSFYALVFELILRLKGNYLWPAMKNSMFYVDDVANGALADEFGVVMGTSHHEPMARAYREQERNLDGRWDWSLNKENLTAFMKEGAERSKGWETVYTMGMRGEGDTESPTLTAPQLEEIIAVQQEILNATHGSLASGLPKVWALYKVSLTTKYGYENGFAEYKKQEVGKYYQQGLQVPDDVTLLWTDDNFGNLLRTPYPNETSRTGGAGVYHHVNYVGRPKIYEWINTIQLVKTWEQMHLAYEKGAREVWIVNVGDIKPLEIPMTHFLDMAYDMSLHLTPTSTTTWLEAWTSKTFSPDVASAVADILNRYGRLVNRRKYETLNMPPFVYSTLFYDEATTALAEWEALLDDTSRVYEDLEETWRDSFYQMILHPVEAGNTVNELYIKAEMGKLYKAQRRTVTNRLAAEVRTAFARDKEISAKYNGINGGKWKGIMCQVHIGYTLWYEPSSDVMPKLEDVSDADVPASGIMGVAGQGAVGDVDEREIVLSEVDPYLPPGQRRWIDVFCRANGTFEWRIEANVSWVGVDKDEGTLEAPGGMDEARVNIEVDWSSAPKGRSTAAFTVHRKDTEDVITINFRSSILQIPRRTWLDAGLSLAASYPSKQRITPPSKRITGSPPKLRYDFFTFAEYQDVKVRMYLGGSRNHDMTRPLRYAFAVDDREAVIVQPVGDAGLGEDPVGWADSVITGGWNVTTSVTGGSLKAGRHELGVWLLEPGAVIQKVVVDLGGVRANGLGPPESLILQDDRWI